MDLQLFVALNAMTISALLIAVSVIYRAKDNPDWLAANGPWLWVNAAVLVAGGLALFFAPDLVGILVMLVFLPLVAAPVFFFMYSQQQSLSGNPKRAAFAAMLAALLHPTIANRVHAKLAAAIAGDDQANEKALNELAISVPREYRPLVQAQLALLKRDWSEILALAGAGAASIPLLKPLEIRALAETGRIDAAVQSFMAARSSLAGAHGAVPLLVVLAFGGRPSGVAAVLEKQFSQMDLETKAYWMGLADLYNPTHHLQGEQTLQKLAVVALNDRTRAGARRQLETFAAAPPRLLPMPTQLALDNFERQLEDNALAPERSYRRVAVTLALIALNLVAFAAEIALGGSENSETLINLGALSPPVVLEQGEWWRLLTAAFLHFGPLHLGSNMFVLWVLGRLLEPILGSIRMLAIYLAGGIISSAFVLWLMTSGVAEYGLLVGASGAIFALLGAEATLVLLSWWRDPANFDTRKLTTLVVMLGLQVAIDLSVPNVSFAAHASGFLAGMVGALLLPLKKTNLRPNKSQSGVNS